MASRLRVLVVCQANTARSVMAHVLLERALAERASGRDIEVRSAGIAPWARDGMLPSLDARLALREVGVDVGERALASTALAGHPELLAAADVVLVMTEEQKRALAARGGADGRVFTLREFAGETGDIRDPAGQGEEAFRACCADIHRCVPRAVERLLAWRRGS